MCVSAPICYNITMNTKQLLHKIIKAFRVSAYYLEKLLKVEHAKFNRYVRGINEAHFNDINQWLELLGLYLYKDNLYCMEHIDNHNRVPLEKETRLFLDAKFDSILDNIQWNESGKRIEETEGHMIFLDNHKAIPWTIRK